ncbi:hypothetical protein [Pedobacter psychrodurus]|uniref:hypothetical protein n=1 Tax=Pedobacter psychrodurus TaxID=2530456 RepID=UPI00292EF48E|nr:hypothetical protein [Pedobacter psychrodurus]
MRKDLFKFRGRFDFSPNPLEIGRPVFRDEGSADNFFLLKMYSLPESSYDEFYNFHLTHFIGKHPDQEKFFYNSVFEILSVRINYYQRIDPFSKKHPIHLEYLASLSAFKKSILKNLKWSNSLAIDRILGEKHSENEELKLRIIELEAQIKQFQQFEPSEKISITKGSLATFMDILRQFQSLQHPSGSKILTFQGYSSWYKLISKYFVHGDKDIPMATAQNYFSPESSIKYTEISPKDKIFEIISKT